MKKVNLEFKDLSLKVIETYTLHSNLEEDLKGMFTFKYLNIKLQSWCAQIRTDH